MGGCLECCEVFGDYLVHGGGVVSEEFGGGILQGRVRVPKGLFIEYGPVGQFGLEM